MPLERNVRHEVVGRGLALVSAALPSQQRSAEDVLLLQPNQHWRQHETRDRARPSGERRAEATCHTPRWCTSACTCRHQLMRP
jgi:hypothetical protein